VIAPSANAAPIASGSTARGAPATAAADAHTATARAHTGARARGREDRSPPCSRAAAGRRQPSLRQSGIVCGNPQGRRAQSRERDSHPRRYRHTASLAACS